LTGRCSPVPSRECCSIFLTMASARLPCCTTFSRSPRSVFINSVISPRLFSFGLASSSTSCNSSINSAESAEKLFTKLSGFLISCAIPAVSWPSEASFCVWTSRSCVVRRSSSDFARCARLHFVEQTDIRDRDHRLVGEDFNELDLVFAERLDSLAGQEHGSAPRGRQIPDRKGRRAHID
jgi:hypothetical protein